MSNPTKVFSEFVSDIQFSDLSSELIDSNRSVVWKQAQNRMFVQQAIILDLI